MAACTSIDKFIVSNTNIAAIDGEYIRSGTLVNTKSIWVKTSNNYKVQYSGGVSWAILNETGGPMYLAIGSMDCPTGLTWNKFFLAPPGAAATATVTAVIPPPLTPVDIRNNKYATATESGANRFRRLNSLGYV